jgi:4-alpha-glucanotransferase
MGVGAVSYPNLSMPGTNRPRSERRRAGVLIPLFSIRTGTGWGLGEIPDLVPMAAWAGQAGIRVVQMLPVCAVSGGETSPYSASTAFAIDPVYLSLDVCEDFVATGGRAALSDGDRALLDELTGAATVPWNRLRSLKDRAMRMAFAHFQAGPGKRGGKRARELAEYRRENQHWVDDWALFSALHREVDKHWKDWPKDLSNRRPAALDKAQKTHADEIAFVTWQQWQLDLQWRKARAEAQSLGVELMGDLPFVVAEDSADVWKHRKLFRPGMRVGAPPDALCAEGQDWGLPLFDWAAMEKTGFAWMRERAERAGRLFGLYRVDHVIGMYRTYYRSADGRKSGFTPSDEESQIRLGETLLALMDDYGEVIAEDLGMVPEFLRPSLTRLGLPGYRVLRWEKEDLWRDGRMQPFFRDPAQWPAISVATSGTHDTTTQAEWYDTLSPDDRRSLARIPGLEQLDPNRGFDDRVRDVLLRVLYQSGSNLCLLPFQDLLGQREQVNVPGSVNDRNWTYRMPMTLAALAADQATTARLHSLAAETRRLT